MKRSSANRFPPSGLKPSKLQSWCEGIIEAGWLAALTVAPLFFNIYSSRTFEPDKTVLVRSLALVMLLAYVLKLIDGGRAWLPAQGESSGPAGQPSESWYHRLKQTPFFLPVLLVVAGYLISTALGVAPGISWWGSYRRLQGTYSLLSYVLIGVLAAAHLRRPEQLRRLRYTVVLTSLPIALYGILQHFNMDPYDADSARVTANAGSPNFLAAYLIMPFCLTLERVFTSLRLLRASEAHRLPAVAKLAGLGTILIAQALTILLTESRGPWLGLAAGLYVFMLLSLATIRPSRYRRWTSVWMGLTLAAAMGLVLINTTPLGGPFRSLPYIGRAATLLDSEEFSNSVRLLTWDGVARMVAPHEPIVFPDGEPDALNRIRPILGFGPDAIGLAANTFYPPGLEEVDGISSQDRAHNEIWERLGTTGLLGSVAYVLLFVAIFRWSLQWLGLIRTRGDERLFLAMWWGGGVLFATAARVIDGGWRLLGPALGMGFLAGMVAYISYSTVFQPVTASADRREHGHNLLIVALLAALSAHYVEIQFGIATAATQTYFWLFTAVLLSAGMRWLPTETHSRSEAPQVTVAPQRSPNREEQRHYATDRAIRTWRTWAPPSTVMPGTLVMLTLAYLFTTNFRETTNPAVILAGSLITRLEAGQPAGSLGVLLLVVISGLIAAALGLSSEARQGARPLDRPGWPLRYILYSLALGGGWMIYGLVQAGRLVPAVAGTDLTTQLNDAAGHFTLFTWVLIGWTVVAGTTFAWQNLGEGRSVMARIVPSLAAGVLGILLVFTIVDRTNVAPVRADVIHRQAQQIESSGNRLSSAVAYSHALSVDPTGDQYMLSLGRTLVELARQAPANSRIVLPRDLTLDQAVALSVDDISRMGRRDLLRAAETVLLEAQRVNPLDPVHTANLARLYREWADFSTDPAERLAVLEKGRDYYAVVTTLNSNVRRLGPEIEGTLANLANAYSRAGRLPEAAESLEQLIAHQPTEFQYPFVLAQIYLDLGRTERAVEAARGALVLAPEAERPAIEEFLDGLATPE